LTRWAQKKTEKIEGLTKMKVKAFSDGKVGWVLQAKGGSIAGWQSHYRVAKETKVYKNAKVAEDEAVRKLDKNESLEFLAGPEFDDAAGAWAKFRVDKDKAVGWVLIQDAKGQRFLNNSK